MKDRTIGSQVSFQIDDLPGADLVTDGLADLRSHRDTPAAALVQMAASRLRSIGFDVPSSSSDEPAAHHLYDLLLEDEQDGAHSRYNAMVARMVSFARAAEHARPR